MKSQIGNHSLQQPDGPVSGCPFLGVRDDPQTRFAFVSPGNCCHRVHPPYSVQLDHQETYCLSKKYWECGVYGIPENSKALRGADPRYLHRKVLHEGSKVWEQTTPEAQGRFEEIKPPLSKFWLGGLGLVALLALIVGLWWGVLRPDRSQQASNKDSGSAYAMELSLATAVQLTRDAMYATLTADAQKTLEFQAQATSQASTAMAFRLAKPTDTPTPAALPTFTPSPTATPSTVVTQAPADLYTCQDIGAYTIEIVSGPQLTPDPGYIYIEGDRAPVVRATWLVKNTSKCDWTQLAVYDQESMRTLAPLLRLDDQPVSPVSYGEHPLLAPGGQIEVTLAFYPSSARNINGDWVLVVNRHTLFDQPYLSLDVNDWVIRVVAYAPTATASQPAKPTSKPPSGGGTSPTHPPASTPAPPPRPTEPPPTGRP